MDVFPRSTPKRSFLERAKSAVTIAMGVREVTINPWLITPWEIDMGKKIAVGVLFLDPMEDVKKAFDREVTVWYSLSQENILPLHGACANIERPIMVSPLMANANVSKYIETHELPVTRRIKLLLDIAQGMQYLHSRGIVHGDLKGLNILVDKHGNALITDLRFARVRYLTQTSKTLVAPTVGTRRWMAPEHLSHGNMTQAGDTYAFALICYEILSGGRIPFENIPDAALIHAVVQEKIRPRAVAHPDEHAIQRVWRRATTSMLAWESV
ncbi:kinase-like protein [Gonapodya prolifera JEL478]|uniref:Kinase-like protein n=1 Tax=Gonapodya prolifera (strain JEL478) TaxID=1344416 RepID=A0A139A9P7_GONPJ|nr:kinase-like protein [Gonapodya prolifera JEL478]|eukprot:KXS13185.1 kinase-like protein [Gonapodya prolifera JEL478]